jgi:hypothetical protein
VRFPGSISLNRGRELPARNVTHSVAGGRGPQQIAKALCVRWNRGHEKAQRGDVGLVVCCRPGLCRAGYFLA